MRQDQGRSIWHSTGGQPAEVTVNGVADAPHHLGLKLAAIVLLVALPIRLCVATRAAMISRDAANFAWYAQALADDPIAAMREHVHHPLYPALVLAAHKVLGVLAPGLADDPVRGWTVALVSVALIGGLAVVVAAYAVTAALFGRRVGLIAAALAAAAAEFCQLSADGLSDMPHLAVHLLAVAAVLRGTGRRRLRWLLFAGILSGLAFLTRPEGAEVALVAAAMLLVAPQHWLLRKRLAGVVAVSLGAMCVAAPYMYVTGKLVQKKSVKQFFQADQPDERAAGFSPRGLSFALAASAPNPCAARAQARGPLNAGAGVRACLAAPQVVAMGSPLQVIRALGPIAENYGRSLRVTMLLPVVVWLARRRDVPGNALGCRFVLAVGLLHLLLLIALIIRFNYWELFSLRHVMVLAGLTLPFSAAGVATILGRVPEARRGLVALIVAVALIGPTLPWMLEKRYADDVYLRRAGEWIRRQAEGVPRVLAERHQAAFYAGGVRVVSPLGADAGQILAAARQARPEWLVFDERRMLGTSPDFFAELQRAVLPPEVLERVHLEPGSGKRAKDRAIVYHYRAPP